MPALGDLEVQVMRRIWARREPVTVREVLGDLQRDRNIAYTTVMTVMGNLATSRSFPPRSTVQRSCGKRSRQARIGPRCSCISSRNCLPTKPARSRRPTGG